MPKKLIEITATYVDQRYRFEGSPSDTIIGMARMDGDVGDGPVTVTIKGQVDADDELQQHLSYRFYGSWVDYTNTKTQVTEKQFHFRTYVRGTPHGRAGIVRYLEKAPNIGRILAARLFDKFHGDAVRILREQPDVAAAACDRLSIDGAIEAAKWLDTEKALEDCTIDLIDLFDGRGFRKSLARDVVKEFGNRAAQVVRKNPYILQRFHGCGFKLADALYLDLGGRPAAMKRQAMCATYAVAQATSQTGDTWHFVEVANQGLKGSVAGADVKLGEALRLADRGQIMCRMWTDGRDGKPCWDGGTQWVADVRKARNEARLAEYVAEAMVEPGIEFYFGDRVVDLSEHQWDNLGRATGRGAIGILGGSPGTGKTYTAAAFIKLLIARHGADSIAVIGPTGKSAVRISEVMASYGIPIRARTIHSLLKVEQADSRGGWSFSYGRANPLPFRFIIVDESSMIDTDLMAALMAARARGTYVLFVGDVNQLPPVGHGAPLRDMIAAGLPYGELREIHRNDGGIVQACADIRDGKAFECNGNLHNGLGHTPQQQIDRMLDIINDVATEQGLDRVWDFQPLVAVNKKSPLSRREVNRILQNHLNPNPIVDGSPFRLQDKAVNLKNGYYPPVDKDQPASDEIVTNERGDLYVANGEIGEVVRVEPKFFEVKLTAPDRLVRVPRSGGDKTGDDDGADDDDTGTGCKWDLAYALSTWKAQGSEWPIIIALIDEYPGAQRLCSKEYWYTSISRAKRACYLVGNLATVQRGCRQSGLKKRKTFLTHLIHQAHDELHRHQVSVLRAEEERSPAHCA